MVTLLHTYLLPKQAFRKVPSRRNMMQQISRYASLKREPPREKVQERHISIVAEIFEALQVLIKDQNKPSVGCNVLKHHEQHLL